MEPCKLSRNTWELSCSPTNYMYSASLASVWEMHFRARWILEPAIACSLPLYDACSSVVFVPDINATSVLKTTLMLSTTTLHWLCSAEQLFRSTWHLWGCSAENSASSKADAGPSQWGMHMSFVLQHDGWLSRERVLMCLCILTPDLPDDGGWCPIGPGTSQSQV